MSVRISNNTLEVFNPATGEDLKSLPISTLSELDSIFNIANHTAENYNFSSFYRLGEVHGCLDRQYISGCNNTYFACIYI